MNAAWEEYRALWRHYGIDAQLPANGPKVAPTAALPEAPYLPKAPLDHLVRVEGPKEPRLAFVLCLPKEDLRFRRDEEALWERILQALELRRSDVALVQVSCLVGGTTLTWDHFQDALPPSIHTLVFFGRKPLPAEAAGDAGVFPWNGESRWIATHELGRLLRDAQAKKETWGALKDLLHRLK